MQKTGGRLHAYVLMTNHVHLLLTPNAADDILRLIIALGRRFVRYINKTYRRTGTLWDSRYKSSLIQTDTYLLRCQRYIELNPVRADMVRDPGEYAQGSMLGVATGPTGWARAIRCSRPIPCIWSWETRLSPGRRPIGNCFALAWTKLHSRRLRLAIQQSQPIGSERFLQQIEQMTGQRREARPRGRPRLAPDGPAVLPRQMELGL